MSYRSKQPHRSTLESASPSPSIPTWIAKFGMNKRRSGKEEVLEAEVEKLREQLKQANMEKSEINWEYEKLSTICRSQRQQLHGIKQALASTTVPPNKTQPHQEDPSDNSKPVNTGKSHQSKSGAKIFAASSQGATVPVTNMNTSKNFGGLRNNERNLTC